MKGVIIQEFDAERLYKDVQSGKVKTFNVRYHFKSKHGPHLDLNVKLIDGTKEKYRLVKPEGAKEFPLKPWEMRTKSSEGLYAKIIPKEKGTKKIVIKVDSLKDLLFKEFDELVKTSKSLVDGIMIAPELIENMVEDLFNINIEEYSPYAYGNGNETVQLEESYDATSSQYWDVDFMM